MEMHVCRLGACDCIKYGSWVPQCCNAPMPRCLSSFLGLRRAATGARPDVALDVLS